MDRAYSSGAAGSAPSAPASPSIGYPTAGNPVTGTPSTKPGAYWYHMVMEELLAIVSAAGITPDQTKLTQLASAIQSGKLFSAAAGGTADAITASFSPAITTLFNGMALNVRASSANATTTPTFTPNSGTVAAKQIVKGNGLALVAGDIAGGGHWIELQYDQTLDKWVLLNPATGVVSSAQQASTTEVSSETAVQKYISPDRLSSSKRVTKAWCNFDGTLTGTITPRASLNVSSVTKNGTGDYTVNFTNAMADANYAIQTSFGGDTSMTYYSMNTSITAPTTTSCRVRCGTVTSAGQDPVRANITIHGN